MNAELRKQKVTALYDLKVEAKRLLKKIEEASSDLTLNEWPSPHCWSAVKRASLDLGREGVKFRRS